MLHPGLADAAVSDALIRFPDADATAITFVARSTLYLADRSGGNVRRMLNGPGEITAPHFSPDGKWIAFTQTIGGSNDVWVIAASGGMPKRLTFDALAGAGDNLVITWTPDSRAVVFLSRRGAVMSKQIRAFTIDVAGGIAAALPLDMAGTMTFGPDGHSIAYNRIFRNFELRKRYLGGQHQVISTYDFKTRQLLAVISSPGTSIFPMWAGRKIYFVSDRGPGWRENLWVHDLDRRTDRQLTHFADFDIDFPSLGGGAILFAQAGRLFEFNLASQALRQLTVSLPADDSADKPHEENVGALARATEATGGVDYALSPGGQQALFSAHGNLFEVGADGGAADLTKSVGSDEDHPAWSDDGRSIAYTSDADGEQQIKLRNQSGTRILTRFKTGFLHRPTFSPNGRWLSAADANHRLWLISTDDFRNVLVAEDPQSEIRDAAFSPDSRWLAYSRKRSNRQSAIHLYEIATGRDWVIGSSMQGDRLPVFSEDGRTLYFVSPRYELPILSDRDDALVASVNSDGVFAASLFDPAGRFDPAGLMSRATVLGITPANIATLERHGGSLIYQTLPLSLIAGPVPGETGKLNEYDIATGTPHVLVDDLDNYSMAADGGAVLFRRDGAWRIATRSAAWTTQPLDLGAMRMQTDPRADWAEMMRDAWRLDRDVFFSSAMNGSDWDAVGRKILPLARQTTASEGDFLYWLGQLQGELATSHSFIERGDAASRGGPGPTAKLGADFAFDPGSGHVRLAHIYQGDNTRAAFRSPLARPDLDLHDNDFLLAVDGKELRTPTDPESLLIGVHDPLRLTVSRTLTGMKREIVVQPVASDLRLRLHDWIEANRERVSQLSNGKVGYVFLSDFNEIGSEDLLRQFAPQLDKQGLVFDIRWNRGGFTSQAVLGLLKRTLAGVFVNREQALTALPSITAPRAMAVIINAFSASDGDQFPYYFRADGIGPVVGTRSWGGVQGINGPWQLMDGTRIFIPKDSLASVDGHWVIENEGVAPDVEINSRPDEAVTGRDAQLEAAVGVVMHELDRHPAQPLRAPASLPAYPPAGNVPGASFSAGGTGVQHDR